MEKTRELLFLFKCIHFIFAYISFSVKILTNLFAKGTKESGMFEFKEVKLQELL